MADIIASYMTPLLIAAKGDHCDSLKASVRPQGLNIHAHSSEASSQAYYTCSSQEEQENSCPDSDAAGGGNSDRQDDDRSTPPRNGSGDNNGDGDKDNFHWNSAARKTRRKQRRKQRKRLKRKLKRRQKQEEKRNSRRESQQDSGSEQYKQADDSRIGDNCISELQREGGSSDGIVDCHGPEEEIFELSEKPLPEAEVSSECEAGESTSRSSAQQSFYSTEPLITPEAIEPQTEVDEEASGIVRGYKNDTLRSFFESLQEESHLSQSMISLDQSAPPDSETGLPNGPTDAPLHQDTHYSDEASRGILISSSELTDENLHASGLNLRRKLEPYGSASDESEETITKEDDGDMFMKTDNVSDHDQRNSFDSVSITSPIEEHPKAHSPANSKRSSRRQSETDTLESQVSPTVEYEDAGRSTNDSQDEDELDVNPTRKSHQESINLIHPLTTPENCQPSEASFVVFGSPSTIEEDDKGLAVEVERVASNATDDKRQGAIARETKVHDRVESVETSGNQTVLHVMKEGDQDSTDAPENQQDNVFEDGTYQRSTNETENASIGKLALLSPVSLAPQESSNPSFHEDREDDTDICTSHHTQLSVLDAEQKKNSNDEVALQSQPAPNHCLGPTLPADHLEEKPTTSPETDANSEPFRIPVSPQKATSVATHTYAPFSSLTFAHTVARSSKVHMTFDDIVDAGSSRLRHSPSLISHHAIDINRSETSMSSPAINDLDADSPNDQSVTPEEQQLFIPVIDDAPLSSNKPDNTVVQPALIEHKSKEDSGLVDHIYETLELDTKFSTEDQGDQCSSPCDQSCVASPDAHADAETDDDDDKGREHTLGDPATMLPAAPEGIESPYRHSDENDLFGRVVDDILSDVPMCEPKDTGESPLSYTCEKDVMTREINDFDDEAKQSMPPSEPLQFAPDVGAEIFDRDTSCEREINDASDANSSSDYTCETDCQGNMGAKSKSEEPQQNLQTEDASKSPEIAPCYPVPAGNGIDDRAPDVEHVEEKGRKNQLMKEASRPVSPSIRILEGECVEIQEGEVGQKPSERTEASFFIDSDLIDSSPLKDEDHEGDAHLEELFCCNIDNADEELKEVAKDEDEGLTPTKLFEHFQENAPGSEKEATLSASPSVLISSDEPDANQTDEIEHELCQSPLTQSHPKISDHAPLPSEQEDHPGGSHIGEVSLDYMGNVDEKEVAKGNDTKLTPAKPFQNTIGYVSEPEKEHTIPTDSVAMDEADASQTVIRPSACEQFTKHGPFTNFSLEYEGSQSDDFSKVLPSTKIEDAVAEVEVIAQASIEEMSSAELCNRFLGDVSGPEQETSSPTRSLGSMSRYEPHPNAIQDGEMSHEPGQSLPAHDHSEMPDIEPSPLEHKNSQGKDQTERLSSNDFEELPEVIESEDQNTTREKLRSTLDEKATSPASPPDSIWRNEPTASQMEQGLGQRPQLHDYSDALGLTEFSTYEKKQDDDRFKYLSPIDFENAALDVNEVTEGAIAESTPTGLSDHPLESGHTADTCVPHCHEDQLENDWQSVSHEPLITPESDTSNQAEHNRFEPTDDMIADKVTSILHERQSENPSISEQDPCQSDGGSSRIHSHGNPETIVVKSPDRSLIDKKLEGKENTRIGGSCFKLQENLGGPRSYGAPSSSTTVVSEVAEDNAKTAKQDSEATRKTLDDGEASICNSASSADSNSHRQSNDNEDEQFGTRDDEARWQIQYPMFHAKDDCDDEQDQTCLAAQKIGFSKDTEVQNENGAEPQPKECELISPCMSDAFEGNPNNLESHSQTEEDHTSFSTSDKGPEVLERPDEQYEFATDEAKSNTSLRSSKCSATNLQDDMNSDFVQIKEACFSQGDGNDLEESLQEQGSSDNLPYSFEPSLSGSQQRSSPTSSSKSHFANDIVSGEACFSQDPQTEARNEITHLPENNKSKQPSTQSSIEEFSNEFHATVPDAETIQAENPSSGLPEGHQSSVNTAQNEVENLGLDNGVADNSIMSDCEEKQETSYFCQVEASCEVTGPNEVRSHDAFSEGSTDDSQIASVESGDSMSTGGPRVESHDREDRVSESSKMIEETHADRSSSIEEDFQQHECPSTDSFHPAGVEERMTNQEDEDDLFHNHPDGQDSENYRAVETFDQDNEKAEDPIESHTSCDFNAVEFEQEDGVEGPVSGPLREDNGEDHADGAFNIEIASGQRLDVLEINGVDAGENGKSSFNHSITPGSVDSRDPEDTKATDHALGQRASVCPSDSASEHQNEVERNSQFSEEELEDDYAGYHSSDKPELCSRKSSTSPASHSTLNHPADDLVNPETDEVHATDGPIEQESHQAFEAVIKDGKETAISSIDNHAIPGFNLEYKLKGSNDRVDESLKKGTEENQEDGLANIEIDRVPTQSSTDSVTRQNASHLKERLTEGQFSFSDESKIRAENDEVDLSDEAKDAFTRTFPGHNACDATNDNPLSHEPACCVVEQADLPNPNIENREQSPDFSCRNSSWGLAEGHDDLVPNGENQKNFPRNTSKGVNDENIHAVVDEHDELETTLRERQLYHNDENPPSTLHENSATATISVADNPMLQDEENTKGLTAGHIDDRTMSYMSTNNDLTNPSSKVRRQPETLVAEHQLSQQGIDGRFNRLCYNGRKSDVASNFVPSPLELIPPLYRQPECFPELQPVPAQPLVHFDIFQKFRRELSATIQECGLKDALLKGPKNSETTESCLQSASSSGSKLFGELLTNRDGADDERSKGTVLRSKTVSSQAQDEMSSRVGESMNDEYTKSISRCSTNDRIETALHEENCQTKKPKALCMIEQSSSQKRQSTVSFFDKSPLLQVDLFSPRFNGLPQSADPCKDSSFKDPLIITTYPSILKDVFTEKKNSPDKTSSRRQKPTNLQKQDALFQPQTENRRTNPCLQSLKDYRQDHLAASSRHRHQRIESQEGPTTARFGLQPLISVNYNPRQPHSITSSPRKESYRRVEKNNQFVFESNPISVQPTSIPYGSYRLNQFQQNEPKKHYRSQSHNRKGNTFPKKYAEMQSQYWGSSDYDPYYGGVPRTSRAPSYNAPDWGYWASAPPEEPSYAGYPRSYMNGYQGYQGYPPMLRRREGSPSSMPSGPSFRRRPDPVREPDATYPPPPPSRFGEEPYPPSYHPYPPVDNPGRYSARAPVPARVPPGYPSPRYHDDFEPEYDPYYEGGSYGGRKRTLPVRGRQPMRNQPQPPAMGTPLRNSSLEFEPEYDIEPDPRYREPAQPRTPRERPVDYPPEPYGPSGRRNSWYSHDDREAYAPKHQSGKRGQERPMSQAGSFFSNMMNKLRQPVEVDVNPGTLMRRASKRLSRKNSRANLEKRPSTRTRNPGYEERRQSMNPGPETDDEPYETGSDRESLKSPSIIEAERRVKQRLAREREEREDLEMEARAHTAQRQRRKEEARAAYREERRLYDEKYPSTPPTHPAQKLHRDDDIADNEIRRSRPQRISSLERSHRDFSGTQGSDRTSSWIEDQIATPPEAPPIVPTITDLPERESPRPGTGEGLKRDRRLYPSQSTRSSKPQYEDFSDDDLDEIRAERRRHRPGNSRYPYNDYDYTNERYADDARPRVEVRRNARGRGGEDDDRRSKRGSKIFGKVIDFFGKPT